MAIQFSGGFQINGGYDIKPVIDTPPVTTGMIGYYTAASFVSGNQWTDLSGSGNNATVSGGPAVTSSSGNGSSKTFNTVSGGPSDSLTWPVGVLPSTYTLFHVTRYTQTGGGRIFDGIGQNWLSGFWSNGTGVAYHNGWINQTDSGYGTNWFVSSDQNTSYWANGTLKGSTGAGSPSNARLSIMNGVYTTGGVGEVSYWACAEVIIYNTTLGTTDRQSVEAYLRSKYGITT